MSRRKKSRRKKYMLSLIATLLILAMIYVAYIAIRDMLAESAYDERLSGPYEVAYVVDGDTIIVNMDGAETRVRLIGIDTPESVADESYKENTPEGEEASKYSTNLLSGNSVYLEYDTEKQDSYGRTLCYVFLSDKKTMANELILKNGYARTMAIEPNTKYQTRLAAAELSAKQSRAGFWGTGYYQ